MEVRCPKCYSPNISNGQPVEQVHGHPNTDTQRTQIEVGGKPLTADVCTKCGHIVRLYC